MESSSAMFSGHLFLRKSLNIYRRRFTRNKVAHSFGSYPGMIIAARYLTSVGGANLFSWRGGCVRRWRIRKALCPQFAGISHFIVDALDAVYTRRHLHGAVSNDGGHFAFQNDVTPIR